MVPDVQRWLDFAENDLAVAKHLLETFHPKPLEIICYHCQQAAEKAIKSRLYCTWHPWRYSEKARSYVPA